MPSDYAMGRRERVAEDLMAFYREKFCAKCKLSFACLMGRSYRETFWCQKCKGWWLADHDFFVRCDGFPGTTYGVHDTHRKTNRIVMVPPHHGRVTIASCPLCDPQGENPLEVIEGFVMEEA